MCTRCLEGFLRDFTAGLHLLYMRGVDPLKKSERIRLKPIDIERIYYTGTQIDVGIGIREAIMLAIPIAPLCQEKCLGLCPVCGINKNKEKCNCRTGKAGFFTPPSHKKKRKTKVRGKK
jgi:uncharacterized protein